MANFDSDPRRKQEMKGRPIADSIYLQIFGDRTKIKRFDQEDGHVLDRHFAIDAQLELSSGQILLGQEKFLSNKYSKFESITVEYMQNPRIKECGDWFRLSAQFYFVGYFNAQESGFMLWAMVDWCKLVIETLQGNIQWRSNDNQNGGARANFRYCNMKKLPEGCILYSSFGDTSNIIDSATYFKEQVELPFNYPESFLHE